MPPEAMEKIRLQMRAAGYSDKVIDMNFALSRAMDEARANGTAIDPRNGRRFRMVGSPYEMSCRISTVGPNGVPETRVEPTDSVIYKLEYVDDV